MNIEHPQQTSGLLFPKNQSPGDKKKDKKVVRTIFAAEVEALLVKERNARQDSNAVLSCTLACEIVKLVNDAGNVDHLCEIITLLSTKRGQPVKAQIEMVKLCMIYVKDIQN